MKKSMKRIALAMSAIMLLGAASGCGKKNNVADGDVTTVTYWTGEAHSKEVMTEFINNWNEKEGKEKGIYIDYQIQGGDSLTQTIELALQSGTAPDILGGGDMAKLAEGDQIWAIEDLPGGEEFLKKYDEKGLLMEDRDQYKGKTYRVPINATPQGMVYNKDMFKAAGIVDENGEAKAPTTWSEIREDAKILTDAAKGQYGIILPLKWSGWASSEITSPAMSLCGYQTYNPATGKYDFSSCKDPMEAWLGMKEDGSIYPGAEGMDNDSARALFAEGKVGMKFAFSFDVGVLTDQFPAKCDWGVAGYPIGEDGTGYLQRMDYGYTAYLNKASKASPEKLMEVLKLLSSDEYIKWMYQKCMYIPYDGTIVEGVELSEAKPGWEDFAKLTIVSTLVPRGPKSEATGLEGLADLYTKHVMTGEMTVDEAIKKAEENAEAGIKQYYDIHPEESRDDYIVKDFNPGKQDPVWTELFK